MELVDDIESYGKAASRMITKYNPVFQRPIVTPNISKFYHFHFLLIINRLDVGF